MKLEFNKDSLINALATVSRAIPSRTTNPILECVLFDASDEEIKLTANDTEFGIETKVEGTIAEKGKVALNARLITEIIRKLEGGEMPVTIQTKENFLTTISCDHARFDIPGRDGEEFSYLPDIEKNNYICLSQFTLKEAVKNTIFAAALNDTNKMMGGEYVEVNGDSVRFVALDGHRIAIRNFKMKENYGSAKVIVPGKTMSEIGKIMTDDNEKDVLIYFSENHILFEFEKTIVISRLIDGEYFKINHMLSKDYETKISVNRIKFLNSIDRATVLIRESDHKPIVLDIEDKGIRLKVKSSTGDMGENVYCEKSGNHLTIAFNPKFLLDALRSIDDETVSLYMTNAKAPCYIRDEQESYIYLILPVNFVS